MLPATNSIENQADEGIKGIASEEEVVVQCDICGKKFRSEMFLAKHVANKHADNSHKHTTTEMSPDGEVRTSLFGVGMSAPSEPIDELPERAKLDEISRAVRELTMRMEDLVRARDAKLAAAEREKAELNAMASELELLQKKERSLKEISLRHALDEVAQKAAALEGKITEAERRAEATKNSGGVVCNAGHEMELVLLYNSQLAETWKKENLLRQELAELTKSQGRFGGPWRVSTYGGSAGFGRGFGGGGFGKKNEGGGGGSTGFGSGSGGFSVKKNGGDGGDGGDGGGSVVVGGFGGGGFGKKNGGDGGDGVSTGVGRSFGGGLFGKKNGGDGVVGVFGRGGLGKKNGGDAGDGGGSTVFGRGFGGGLFGKKIGGDGGDGGGSNGVDGSGGAGFGEKASADPEAECDQDGRCELCGKKEGQGFSVPGCKCELRIKTPAEEEATQLLTVALGSSFAPGALGPVQPREGASVGGLFGADMEGNGRGGEQELGGAEEGEAAARKEDKEDGLLDGVTRDSSWDLVQEQGKESSSELQAGGAG